MRELGGETIMLGRTDTQLGRGESDRRHRARAQPLCRHHHDAHHRRGEAPRDGQVCDGAGDQRPHRQDPSLPAHGRRDDLRGASRHHPGQGRSPGRATATTWRRRWIHAAVQFDFELRIACPTELKPPARTWSSGPTKSKGQITIGHDPETLVKNADCVVTDTWVSMGDEDPQSPSAARRHNLLRGYQVDKRLMEHGEERRHLHALPAGASRRGSHRRRDRRAAVGGVRRGREPPARPEEHPGLVPVVKLNYRSEQPSSRRSARRGDLSPIRCNS